MKTIAKVLKVADDYAVVETLRKSACSSCENCQNKNVCSSELVFGNTQQRFEVRAENNLGAAAGQLVEIHSDSRLLLLASFFVFVVPVLLSITVYFLIHNMLASELNCLLIAGLSFVLVFIVTIIFQNKFVEKYLRVRIVRIIEDVEDNK